MARDLHKDHGSKAELKRVEVSYEQNPLFREGPLFPEAHARAKESLKNATIRYPDGTIKRFSSLEVKDEVKK